MYNIIKQYLNTNSEYVLKTSLKNCHVKGLHSVALHASDNRMVRLYIHEPNGSLAISSKLNILSKNMPLAIHPHHCDLVLVGLSGKFTNYNITIEKPWLFGNLDRWVYKSPILTGESGFTKEGSVVAVVKDKLTVKKNDAIFLPAHQAHTVTCRPDEYASWMVLEGIEDTSYIPYSYSNADLSKVSTKGLYQKFESIEEIESLLLEAKI